jgi:hypothetical protein
MSDTDIEPLRRALRSQAAELAGTAAARIDTTSAWRDFRALRARASRRRRHLLTAVAVTATAGVAAAVAVAALLVVAPGRGRPPGLILHPQPVRGHRAPPDVRSYPLAGVTRIPVSAVQSVARLGPWLWAVQMVPPPGPATSRHFNLLKIDTRTQKVVLSVNAGQDPTVVAAGAGTVWRTMPDRARQVARIDPATGRVMLTVRLPAGNCGYLTFVGASLWAECGSGKQDSVFLELDHRTGSVRGRLGPVRGPIGYQSAFTPQGVWYTDNHAGLKVIFPTGASPSGQATITVRDPANPVSFVYTQSLVYGSGAVWALTSDGTVAKIDPVTREVVRTFRCGTIDPGCGPGLSFMAAGQGSLWFLVDGISGGHRTTSVLRASMSTGRPLGLVPVRPGSCGEPCYQIYDIGGRIWVPADAALVAIDPARLPG